MSIFNGGWNRATNTIDGVPIEQLQDHMVPYTSMTPLQKKYVDSLNVSTNSRNNAMNVAQSNAANAANATGQQQYANQLAGVGQGMMNSNITTTYPGQFSWPTSTMYSSDPIAGEACMYSAVVIEDDHARANAVRSSLCAIIKSIDDMPHKVYDSALLLKAGVQDVVGEINKIAGIGSVRKLADGVWAYHIYS